MRKSLLKLMAITMAVGVVCSNYGYSKPKGGAGKSASPPRSGGVMATPPQSSKPLPVPVTALNSTTVCVGQTVTLQAPAGFARYKWSNGDTTQTIQVSASGHYTVRVANSLGGQFSDTLGGFYTSGLTVYPVGATGNDSVYFFLNPSLTCPLPSSNAFQSLFGASEVRAHLGVRLNGNNWQNVVGANDGQATSPSQFKSYYNGSWVKAMLPKNYNNAGSTTIEAFNFVLTGDPQNGGWFNREGKVQPGCGDFYIPLPVTRTAMKSPFGVTVTVLAKPTAPTLSAPDTVRFCSGGSYTITASGGSNYYWSNNSTGNTLTVTSSGTYYATYMVGSCESDTSRKIVVEVSNSGLPSPTPTAGGPTSFCPGGSVVLDAGTLPIGQSYVWSTGDTTQTITVNRSGAYTVRARQGSCFSNPSSAINVTVYAKPLPVQVSAQGPTSICTGDNVVLSAPTGYSQYLWNNGATTRTITVSTSGHYTVRVANATGCWSDTLGGYHVSGLTFYPVGGTAADSIYLFLNPAKTCPLPTSNANQSLFGTNVVRIHGGVTIGGNPWNNVVATNNPGTEPSTRFKAWGTGWVKAMVPASFYSATGVTGLNFVLNGGNSTGGWFEREGKVEPGCGDFGVTFPITRTAMPSPFGITVTVNSAPAAPTLIAAGATTFCQGNSVVLRATGGTPGMYVWSNNSTADTLLVTTAGNYSVRSYAGACTSAISNVIAVTVTSTTAPVASAQGPTTFCAGGSVVLSTPNITGATYEWSNGATTRTITVRYSGSYSVRVYRNGCGSAFSTPIAVTVNPRPLPALVTTIGATDLCQGDSVILVAPNGYPIYRWSNGATTNRITVKTAGNYTVRVANANGCLSDTLSGQTISGVTLYPVGATASDSVYLFVNPQKTCPLPSNTFQSLAGANVVRIHGGVTIGGNGWQNVVSTTNGTVEPTTRFSQGNGYWYKAMVASNFYGGNGITGLNFVLNGGPASGGWFQREGKNVSGCSDFGFSFPVMSSGTASPFGVSVTVKPRPIAATITGPTSICTGSTATFTTGRVLANNEEYLWSNGATTQSINVTAAGNYWLKIRNNVTGCISLSSSVIQLAVNPVPAAPSVTPGGPTTFPLGGSVDLTSTGTGTILWSNGATGNPLRVTVSGSYTAQVISNGCTSAASSPVVVTVQHGLPDLVVTSNISSSGTFYNVTITNTGHLTLNGDLVVQGAMNVSGTLETNGYQVTGTGEFNALAGSTLKISNAQGINQRSNVGDVVVTGSRRFSGDATYQYVGTTQVTGDALPFTTNNLVVNVAGSLNLTGPVRISNMLDLRAGTFNLDNKEVTLLSTATKTASIPAIGTGSVANAGNMMMQRYISPIQVDPLGGWFLLGSPMNGQTANSWNGNFNPYSANTYNQSTPMGSSIYFYDPTWTSTMSNNGYRKPTGPTQAVSVGKGARVWVRNGWLFINYNSALSTKGTPHLGPFSWNSLAYCASGCANNGGGNGANGWNLLANPYPSTIDWDASGAWTRNNVADGVYTYDYLAGRFDSYVGGVGTNNGSNLLASSQGFFVLATGSNPSMNVTEQAKVGTNTGLRRVQAVQNVLKAKLMVGGQSDEVAIRLDATATSGFDASLDAMNYSNEGQVDLSILGVNGGYYSIDARSALNQTTQFDLAQRIAANGTISFNGLGSFTAGQQLFLLNRANGSRQPIFEGMTVAITPADEFSIVVDQTVTDLNAGFNPVFAMYPNPANQVLNLQFANEGTRQIQIVNAVGKLMLTTTVAGQQPVIDIAQLPAGVYMVRIAGHQTQKLVKE